MPSSPTKGLPWDVASPSGSPPAGHTAPERTCVSHDARQLKELHDALVNSRDAVAQEINRLDANPPESRGEFIAVKIWLMNHWRDLSILRMQVAYAAGLESAL